MQSECSEQSLEDLIRKLGFTDFSVELVTTAFTHSSYTKEQNLPYDQCYERLEFLGDAVLKMVVTDYLYKKYPDKKEGDLTKIRSIVVSDEILYQVAQNIGIENYIFVGKAEKREKVNTLKSVQACTIEALLGALYLSSDKEKIKNFVISELEDFIEDLAQNKTIYNAKAILQEYAQAKSKELPVYKLLEEIGAAHNKTFVIGVYYQENMLAKAQGKTKKQAEKEAAFIACKELGLISEEK